MTGGLLVLVGFGVLVFRAPGFGSAGVSAVNTGCCSEAASPVGSGMVVIVVWYEAGCAVVLLVVVVVV